MIKLKAKTLTGKNKIQNAKDKGSNNIWKIVKQQDKVLFSNEPGPWLRIVPINNNNVELSSLSRWIHLNNDKDFEIIEE